MPSINISHITKKNSWASRESNPGLLGEKQVFYLWAIQFPALKLLNLASAFFSRHCRICLFGAVHLRDAAPNVGPGTKDLLRVLVQPVRLPRHLRQRLRGRLEPLQAQGWIFRALRSQSSEASENF